MQRTPDDLERRFASDCSYIQEILSECGSRLREIEALTQVNAKLRRELDVANFNWRAVSQKCGDYESYMKRQFNEIP